MNVAELMGADLTHSATNGKMYGVATAVVTNTGDPGELGRVKVRYPWLDDDAESPWARVVTPMAGASRGMVFRPEVGDEVLVAFEHGDVRFPFVMGSLWNATDPPPDHGSDADNHKRVIRSRSGHEITLDDTPGAEKVIIVDQSASHRIELSSSGVVIDSAAVQIGSSGSSEGLVLGNALLQLFNQHTHPTGVGPSGPPAQPMVSGTHVSTKHKTE